MIPYYIWGGTNDSGTYRVKPGFYEIRVKFPSIGLIPGKYSLDTYLRDKDFITLDIVEAFTFTVDANGRTSESIYYQEREWSIVKVKEISYKENEIKGYG